MENKIEFLFKTDSNGDDIDLNDMPLDVAISIRDIFNSLLEIALHEPELNLNVGMRRGSAAPRLLSNSGENLRVVYNKIKDAATVSPERDNVYVNNLNIIHSRSNNFKDVDISIIIDGEIEDIKPLFEKKFKKRVIRDVNIGSPLTISFIEGKLEQNGGANPNFHIRLANGGTSTIKCTESQSKKLGTLIYENIKLTAWSKTKKDKIEHTFCDVYVSNSEIYYEEFQRYYNELIVLKGTKVFHHLKSILQSYYDSKDYAGAKKFIRLFLNENATVTHLRTILLISKGFKYNEDMEDIIEKVEQLLVSKIGEIY